MSRPVFDAIVLAGGQARRLGGVSKAEVPVAGRALLDHALAAADGAQRVVVVGPPELARPGVPTVLEHPPAGGPVAGIDAGLAYLTGAGPAPADALTLVLACDVPQAAAAVPRLFDALLADAGADGAHLVDDGHPQLVALYRRAPLVAALDRLVASGGVHGVSVRRLGAELRMTDVDDPEHHGADADTWDDVQHLDILISRRQT